MSRRTWILAGVAGAAMLAGTAAGAKAQAPAGAPPAATAPTAAKPPAVVNGEVISRAELDAALKQVGGPSPVEVTDDVRRAQQMQVLSLMIDDKLMRQFLAKSTPPATAAEITARVAVVEAELTKQKKTLADFLKENGQTETAFHGDVAEAVEWDNYARSKISDAAVAQYYKDNKDFFDRIMVRASHIVLRLPPNATEADKAKAKQQLTDLRAQLAANKIDFAEAAKKYSQCPTAPKGGDLGFFPRRFAVDDAISQAAFSTPVNQISDVVQTGYGLHLIKVTERKPGEPSDFTKIKDDVREVCAEEMRMSVLAELRRNGKIEIVLP